MLALLKIIVTLCLLFTILILVFSFTLLYLNTHPPRYALNLNPKQYHLDYHEIWFTNDQGLKLKGWFIKSNQESKKPLPTIIICHGLGSNKSDFIDLAQYLVHHGYHAFLFDLRAHGESEGSRCSLGLYEQRDLTGAIDYLITREDINPDKIGVFGFSLGGAIALMQAAHDQRITAVVADSTFASLKEQVAHTLSTFYHIPSCLIMPSASLLYRIYFRGSMNQVSPLKSVNKISPRAIMLIGGEQDTQIPPSSIKKLFEAAKEPKLLWLVPEAHHGETLSIDQKQYRERIVTFFDQYLKGR